MVLKFNGLNLRGKPDNGSLDLTTRSNWLSEMFEVSSKPVIFDADNGGPKEHLKFLVNKLEKLEYLR